MAIKADCMKTVIQSKPPTHQKQGLGFGVEGLHLGFSHSSTESHLQLQVSWFLVLWAKASVYAASPR